MHKFPASNLMESMILLVFDVQPDGIVHFDDGVGITDGTTVRGVQVRDILGSGLDLSDTAQLIFSFLVGNSVDGESTLNVIDKTEVFLSLLNLDNIHKTRGEVRVGTHFTVDLDQTLLQDSLNLLGRQGVPQPVPQEQTDRHRFPQLMGSGLGTNGVNTSQLVQHP